MTDAGRQYHYSAEHWAKQRRDIDRYIDSLNGNLRTYDIYFRRDYLGRDLTEDDKRFLELRSSAGERLKYAHVNFFKMANDPLRINGISFSVMLDDAKRELSEKIDLRVRELTHEQRLEDYIDFVFRTWEDDMFTARYINALRIGDYKVPEDFPESYPEAIGYRRDA